MLNVDLIESAHPESIFTDRSWYISTAQRCLSTGFDLETQSRDGNTHIIREMSGTKVADTRGWLGILSI